MWCVYIVLIADFFLFLQRVLLWLFGGGNWPPEMPSPFGVFDTIGSYGLVIVMNGAMLIGWALYNQIRFRGKERRKFVPAVSVDDHASMYARSPAEIAVWQTARIVRINHGRGGELEQVSVNGQGAELQNPEAR